MDALAAPPYVRTRNVASSERTLLVGRSALFHPSQRSQDRRVTLTAPRRRAVLIVSPSEERRRDWTAVVEDDRTQVTTCPGPNEQCVLLRGLDETCPLVAKCDVALYDFDATTPSFLATLLRAHRAAEVVLVRDRMVRGRHRPSVVLRRRPRGTAFEAAL